MSNTNNNQNIIISGSKDVDVKDVYQYNNVSNEKDAPLTSEEGEQLKKEISELLVLLNQKYNGPNKATAEAQLTQLKDSVGANAPRSKVIGVLKGAGAWLVDLAKDTGKELILSFLKPH